MSLSVTILGCGTSTGVPTLGCVCGVCKSNDPKNTRWRSSILVRTHNGTPIVVDTGPEFRLQMLRANVTSLEHVFYTHMHADHVHGFDDLRAFYFNGEKKIKCYMDVDYAKELKHRFHYAFEETGYLGGKPDIEIIHLPREATSFQIQGVEIESIRLPHGNVKTNAFRFDNFAYATDFKEFPEESRALWRRKIHTMVASGLRWRPHKTHSIIEETIELFQDLGVKRGIISHLSHEVDYSLDRLRLPEGVEFAYDGLTFEI